MERIPKPKHGSKEWLMERWRDDQGCCVFGASDIPALMNASPYKTRGELFADKLNEPEPQAESAIFRRGNLLEKPLLEAAADFLNHDIYTPDCMYRDGRLTVTLDGVDNSIQPEYIVEAKTTKDQMANMRASMFLINFILNVVVKVSNQWGPYYCWSNIHWLN